MKKTRLLVLAFFILFLSNCSSSQTKLSNVGGYEGAIYNSIIDFTNSRLFNDGSVFYVDYELNEENYYKILILEDAENKLLYSKHKKFEDNRLPNKFMIYKSKLFIWWDDNYSQNVDILNKLESYDMIQDADESPILEHFNDDKKKVAHYFFCKENILKYKRVITNRIKNKDVGINCEL